MLENLFEQSFGKLTTINNVLEKQELQSHQLACQRARKLDNQYYEDLRKSILYWDGEKFVDNPTITLKFKNSRKTNFFQTNTPSGRKTLQQIYKFFCNVILM